MPNRPKSEKVLKKMMHNPLQNENYFLSLHPLKCTRGRREPAKMYFARELNKQIKV